MDEYSLPRAGVGVIVLRGGKVLLGKRRGSHGEGEWALIGGKLDYQESIEDCVRREIREESGLEVENIRFNALFNTINYPPKHFIAIGMIADWKEGEAQTFPEEKISEWGWFSFDELPQPMFADSVPLIKAYQGGVNFLDIGQSL
jgi:8-oxo-dGTP diphosphatase